MTHCDWRCRWCRGFHQTKKFRCNVIASKLLVVSHISAALRNTQIPARLSDSPFEVGKRLLSLLIGENSIFFRKGAFVRSVFSQRATTRGLFQHVLFIQFAIQKASSCSNLLCFSHSGARIVRRNLWKLFLAEWWSLLYAISLWRCLSRKNIKLISQWN